MIHGPIAVVAPSSAFDPDRLAAGLALARDAGFDLCPLPDLLRPERYLASGDEHRASQLIEALTDERYSAVWMVRGGYGLTRILHRLDGLELPPRPILGFSDVTALFCALHPRQLGPLLHAPMPHSLASTSPESLAHLWDVLRGRDTAPLEGEMWVDGSANGWLCGGNLCMLAATCGTPWQLDATGAVLVLEEVGEYPYRIDRNLQQLRSAGVLDGLAAVALGQFLNCTPPADANWTMRDILLDHLEPLGIPIVGDLPIGHGPENRAFPWGVPARVGAGRLAW